MTAPSSPAHRVRTLAISQLAPTFILIWLPTWPDMAIDGSGWFIRCGRRAACIMTRDPDPAISTTRPIAGIGVGVAARRCPPAAVSSL